MAVSGDAAQGGALMLSVDIQAQLGDFALDARFDGPPGVTALFGRSGSGKTSIVNAVAGLLQPDQGRIAVADTILFDHENRVQVPTHKRRIGYVFQDARLFPHMTVQQNLAYGGSYDADRVIEILGLGALLKRRPAKLSGGEKQRVAFGRALMSDPRVLLLDEPLAALDEARKAEIMPYLAELRDVLEIPMLYVSHDMAEVARLATHLVILDAGRVSVSGPVAEVLSRPDAVPFLGPREAGAVIEAKVAGRLLDDDLTELAFAGGRLILPGQYGALGQIVRLRVPAQDIILSREAPQDISALNVLPVIITDLAPGKGPGVAVGLRVGETPLLARVTKRSADRMALAAGQNLFAIIKATAVRPENIGG